MSEAELRKVLNQDPEMSDLILQAFIARRQLLRESPEFTGLRVIGSRYSHDTFRIRDFLARNRALFTWIDLETEPGVEELLKQFGVTEADTPVVACGHMVILRNPSNRELADVIGMRPDLDQALYDVAVVGAGPAGLAAAVYGASEGLQTVVLEHEAVGGQAGTSSMIRNYLGFPRGISGGALALRAFQQSTMFGADTIFMNRAMGLSVDGPHHTVFSSDGSQVTARTVVIATGVRYGRLGIPEVEALPGAGVFYGAGGSEAQGMRGRRVVVVGAGNSAGQAAIHLAKYASQVTMLVRGDA